MKIISWSNACINGDWSLLKKKKNEEEEEEEWKGITKCSPKRNTTGFVGGNYIFTTQNYTLNYTVHHKLFECKFCILNYDICYTMHIDINFTCLMVIYSTWLAHGFCLDDTKLKDQKHSFPNQLKIKTSLFIFYPARQL